MAEKGFYIMCARGVRKDNVMNSIHLVVRLDISVVGKSIYHVNIYF